MTELMYIKHPDLFELSTQVTEHGVDTKGMYFVFKSKPLLSSRRWPAGRSRKNNNNACLL